MVKSWVTKGKRKSVEGAMNSHANQRLLWKPS